jgi:hypothetical protein
MITTTSSVLVNTFAQYENGAFQPRIDDLMAILSEMLLNFNTVYLVIDALDECTDLNEVIEILTNMQSWAVDHLHIIVTSRRLPEIGESVSALTTAVISVDESPIDIDVMLYITHRLETDRSLAKWPLDVRHLIKATLSQGAGGMFVTRIFVHTHTN